MSPGGVVMPCLEPVLTMAAGDFYILCPDNDVTRAMDNARMTWAMQDLTQNRPPLSRWHPDYEHAFAEFLAKETGRG